jgi:hypothetical protein
MLVQPFTERRTAMAFEDNTNKKHGSAMGAAWIVVAIDVAWRSANKIGVRFL